MARIKLTDEEKKRRRDEYAKKYYQANKKRRLEYQKANYQANKERHKATVKVYQEANKHKPTVYYLPEFNYVGVTENLSLRLANHKRIGRVVNSYKVLGVFETRSEALETEAFLHTCGYKGRRPQKLFDVYKY